MIWSLDTRVSLDQWSLDIRVSLDRNMRLLDTKGQLDLSKYRSHEGFRQFDLQVSSSSKLPGYCGGGIGKSPPCTGVSHGCSPWLATMLVTVVAFETVGLTVTVVLVALGAVVAAELVVGVAIVDPQRQEYGINCRSYSSIYL